MYCKPYSTNCWLQKTLASSTEDTVYCKSFDLEKFCGCRNELQFTKKHLQLHDKSCVAKPYCTWGNIAISLEKFHGHQSIHENRETLPPRTIYNIRYDGKNTDN